MWNFIISHIGNYESLEKTKEYKELEKTQIIKGIATSEIAEGVFFQIQITAHNIGAETVRFTGGQFYLFDINQERYEAVFIGYAGFGYNRRIIKGRSFTGQFCYCYNTI